jgi:hypothetical protein
VLRVRQMLQAIVRGQQAPAVLAPELDGVTSVPAIDGGQVSWTRSRPCSGLVAIGCCQLLCVCGGGGG